MILLSLLIVWFMNHKQFQTLNYKILKEYNYLDKNISLFNPTIIKYKNKYLCMARKTTPSLFRSYIDSEVLFSELTDDFTPLEWKIIKLPVPETLKKQYTKIHYEDSRLFVLNDRIFTMKTFVGISPNFDRPQAKMSIFEWDENINLLSMRVYSEFEGINKNWTLFHFEDKNYMLTDFFPFRYYEIDINHKYDLSNKKEIHHEFKKYRAGRVYSKNGKKLKCIAHYRYHYIYYVFRFFEIDIQNNTITPISEDFSLNDLSGLFCNYPHAIHHIDDKLLLTMGFEDRQSAILQITNPELF